MRLKAKLISLDGFKVIDKFEFDEDDYPFNFDQENQVYFRDQLSKSEVSQIQSNYLWVVKKMFPNHLIIDKQGSYSCKGHPDFIAVDEKVRVVKFIEFKSVSDNLSSHQISWFCNNHKKKRFILKLEECASI